MRTSRLKSTGLRESDLQNAEKGVKKMQVFKKFLRNESGASALEYGLIGALIAIGVLAAYVTFKPAIDRLFEG